MPGREAGRMGLAPGPLSLPLPPRLVPAAGSRGEGGLYWQPMQGPPRTPMARQLPMQRDGRGRGDKGTGRSQVDSALWGGGSQAGGGALNVAGWSGKAITVAPAVRL